MVQLGENAICFVFATCANSLRCEFNIKYMMTTWWSCLFVKPLSEFLSQSFQETSIVRKLKLIQRFLFLFWQVSNAPVDTSDLCNLLDSSTGKSDSIFVLATEKFQPASLPGRSFKLLNRTWRLPDRIWKEVWRLNETVSKVSERSSLPNLINVKYYISNTVRDQFSFPAVQTASNKHKDNKSSKDELFLTFLISKP